MKYYSWEKHTSRSKKKGGCLKLLLFFLFFSILLGTTLGLLGYGYLYYRFGEKAASYDLQELNNMERASRVYDRHGVPMGEIFIQHRIPIAYEQIPQKMVFAIVAEEDNRFFEHHGVDVWGILRAAISNYRQGKIKQGASTVTQQLARNSFHLRERSFERKILEAFIAYRIEDNLSKEKIMELYLNKVYFGSGFYGVEAAARGYFGKPTRDLSVGECAMLAGLLKSPNGLSPWHNPEGAQKVRDFVVTRMYELHFITRKEKEEAITQPLRVRKRHHPFKVSYALDLVRQQAIAALGYERVMNGGVRIDTTFDSHLQKAASEALYQQLEQVEKNDNFHHPTYEQYHQAHQKLEEISTLGLNPNFPSTNYLQGSLLAINNHDGGILAMIGGRNFTHSEYNRAIQGTRPAGTLFTPIVAAAAYESGLSPGTIVDDAPLDNHYVMIGGETGILGEWGVAKKENQYEGPMTAQEAVARGKNAATVRLGFLTGLESLQKTAKKLGIQPPIRPLANSYLGSSEVGLDDMTLAFSTIARGGTRPESLYTITKITAPNGQTLFIHKNTLQKALSVESAYQVHTLLQNALQENQPDILTSSSASSEKKEPTKKTTPSLLAGKEGTAYDFTDNWFVGYSSAITCGVWVGFDRPTSIFPGAFGKNSAQPIWKAVMDAAQKEYPSREIKAPNSLYPISVCRSSGFLPISACSAPPHRGTIQIEATPDQLPLMLCSQHSDNLSTSSKFSSVSSKKENTGAWPKAMLAIDLSSIKPIIPQEPTLFTADDPYQSICQKGPWKISKTEEKKTTATNALEEGNSPNNSTGSTTHDNIPIAKAIPVYPEPPKVEGISTEGPNGEENPTIRKAEPVHPEDFPATAAPLLPTNDPEKEQIAPELWEASPAY